MPMTQKQVDALPKLEISIAQYERARRMECPICDGRLRPQAVRYYSTDDVSLPGVRETTVIPSAGCDPCGILYRFDSDPVAVTRFW